MARHQEIAFSLTKQVGSIEVTSTPSGAKIYVNGTDTGKVTPSTLTDQPLGEYSIDVELEGYNSDGPKTVTVSEGGTSAVDFTLSQQFGSIEVTSTPSGAKIYVNGADTGKVTPATLSSQPVGECSVDAQLEGYSSDGPKTVTVTEGGTSAVDFTLSQQFGSIQVTSEPSGAKIFVNGTDTGKVTPTNVYRAAVG